MVSQGKRIVINVFMNKKTLNLCIISGLNGTRSKSASNDVPEVFYTFI